MRYTVLVHKQTGRRGAVMPADKAAAWRWGSGEIDNFDFVTVDLTPEEVEDIRHERKMVRADGRIDAVPEENWPESRTRLENAVRQFAMLERAYGIEEAEKVLAEMRTAERVSGGA